MIREIKSWLRDEKEKDEEKVVNTETEEMVEQPEIRAVYIEQEHIIRYDSYRHHYMPTEPKPKTFTDLKTLRNHILDNNVREKNYLYKQGDEEVRETIKKAFKDRKCRELERRKENAKEQLEETEEKLEEMGCEE